MIQTRTVTLPHGISFAMPRKWLARPPGADVSCTASRKARSSGMSCCCTLPAPKTAATTAWRPTCVALANPANPKPPRPTAPNTWCKDLVALISAVCTTGTVECLVAHDWGWRRGLEPGQPAAAMARRLAVINSPTPARFARTANQRSPAGRQPVHAFLCRPDAESLLAENDFQRLFAFFNTPKATRPHG